MRPCILAVVLLAAHPDAHARPAYARVIEASGEWEVALRPGAAWFRGHRRLSLPQGAAVRTTTGRVRIALPGGATIEIAPGTTIGFPILFRRGRESVAEAALVDGAVRVWERGNARRYVEVVTPAASIGVRGTDFAVRFDGGRTDVEVYEGAVDVSAGGFGDATADADGDGVPAWLDADVDGDGSPNTSDPDDVDPATEGADEVGYEVAQTGEDAVEVEKGEEARIDEDGEAPIEVEPMPEDAEETWETTEQEEAPRSTGNPRESSEILGGSSGD